MTIFLGSGLRNKLLAYVFTHADESYYVRQLADAIDGDAGNLSRELKALEAEGLFTSSTKARAKFYALNRAYPLFDEIGRIVLKTSGVEGSLRSLVAGHDGISRAFLYGSYAARKETAQSDVDLIVVGRCDRDRFIGEVRRIESRLGREINVTFYEEGEFAKGRATKGGFLDLVLKGKVLVLKGKAHAR